MSGAALRIELKAWERDFAIANSGRKPQKDDIKQNAYICIFNVWTDGYIID